MECGLPNLVKTFQRSDTELVGTPRWKTNDWRVLDVEGGVRGTTEKIRRILGLRSLGQEYREWAVDPSNSKRAARERGSTARGKAVRLFVKEAISSSNQCRTRRAVTAGDRALEFETKTKIDGASVLFAANYEAFRVLHDRDIELVASALKEKNEFGTAVHDDIMSSCILYAGRLINCQRVYEGKCLYVWIIRCSYIPRPMSNPKEPDDSSRSNWRIPVYFYSFQL